MYPSFFLISIFFVLFSSTSTFAKDVTEKLQSSAGDQVTIQYRVDMHDDGVVSIKFNSARPALGVEHGKKYRDLSRVKVLFFEQSGGFVEDKFSSDIETDAMMVPSNEMDYDYSKEGFVCLNDFPQLKLTLLMTSKPRLSIPIYLAYYEKKHTYKVFASCGTLEILLDNTKSVNTRHNEDNEVRIDTVIPRSTRVRQEIVQDTEFSDAQRALIVNNIESSLEQSSEIASIDDCIRKLHEMEWETTDENVKYKIQELLQRAEEKKKEIVDQEDLTAGEKASQALEEEARIDLEHLKERLDHIEDLTESDVAELKSIANELRRKSGGVKNQELKRQIKEAADRCDAEVKKIDDAKKQRNIWMIVGGIILAVLLFVGNQLFQHFRNLRNQKRLENMQNNIARRAEDEAKRRTQNMVRSKVNRAQNATRQKSNDLIRNRIKIQVKNPPKGNKNLDV